MATVNEVYGFLDKLAPFDLQMDFDNAGFLVGRGETQVKRLLVALDITLPVVQEAAEKGCQLIVSHHPVIFHPVKALTDQSATGRVLLALALEPIPQILILDEPLSGVDVGGEHLLLDMLDEIRQKYDLSILFSTHDFSTLRHYADKVILLQQAILKVGTPGEVLHSPEFQAVFHLNLGEEGGCAQ